MLEKKASAIRLNVTKCKPKVALVTKMDSDDSKLDEVMIISQHLNGW